MILRKRFIMGLAHAVTSIAKNRAKATGAILPSRMPSTARPAPTTSRRQTMPAKSLSVSGTFSCWLTISRF